MKIDNFDKVMIQSDFRLMRKNGIKPMKAYRILAEKYKVSVKSIIRYVNQAN